MGDMRQPVVPAKLRAGDTLRVVAPAQSRAMIMEHDNTAWIDERFARMGLTLTFGDHVDDDDVFHSGSIEARVADLHAAFADPDVDGILTVIGGFNSNELLPYLDFDLVAANPKVFCGYSDITVLGNAMLSAANLMTYSGPHWSSFGMRDHFEPTGEWFRAAVMAEGPIDLEPAPAWTDDAWFADQDDRRPQVNPGWAGLQNGEAAGRIVGGNLATLNLLQGTAWMPSLGETVLFLEDDYQTNPAEFARDLTSLLQVRGAGEVAGLLVGRFQAASGMGHDVLKRIVGRQPALRGKPVVAGVDFGHTSPVMTFPIGGDVAIRAGDETAVVTITRH